MARKRRSSPSSRESEQARDEGYQRRSLADDEHRWRTAAAEIAASAPLPDPVQRRKLRQLLTGTAIIVQTRKGKSAPKAPGQDATDPDTGPAT